MDLQKKPTVRTVIIFCQILITLMHLVFLMVELLWSYSIALCLFGAWQSLLTEICEV